MDGLDWDWAGADGVGWGGLLLYCQIIFETIGRGRGGGRGSVVLGLLIEGPVQDIHMCGMG